MRKTIIAIIISIILFNCSDKNNPVETNQNSEPQIITISGVVNYEGSNVFVNGAEVFTIPASKTTRTDENGSFILEDIESGNYRIAFVKEGWDSTFFILSSSVITSQEIDISLKNNLEYHQPEGKLPWPHQRSGLSQIETDELIDNVWVINNFGQYQGGDDYNSLYYHDAFDLVEDNGTKIYSVESGIVRAIMEFNEYYSMVIVEDLHNPGSCWGYSHIYYFKVNEGDVISKGTYLGDINFQGLPHVHLTRYIKKEGGQWNDYMNYYSVAPDDYFLYNDDTPPVIDTPFYYFKNNSSEMFVRNGTATLSGKVDIVAAMRDAGEFAHSKDTNFGDRISVAKIEYSISGNGINDINKKSFDFTKIKIDQGIFTGDYVTNVYKFYYDIHSEDPTSWDKIFSYYTITNTDESGELILGAGQSETLCWNTADVPDGQYTITVTAYDFKGNSSSVSEDVIVQN